MASYKVPGVLNEDALDPGGESGGQSATGGTAAGENLTLTSTSHATKGKIILGSASAYDEVNDRLGVGTTSPINDFTVQKAASSVNARIVNSTDTGFATWLIGATAGTSQLSLQAYGTNRTPTAASDFQDSGIVRVLTTGGLTLLARTPGPVRVMTGAANVEGVRATFDSDGNVALGAAVTATDATNGFFFLGSCAGTPTGTPAGSYSGRTPIIWDSTNKVLYAYDGAAWVRAIPAATTSVPGTMSAADKTKADGTEALTTKGDVMTYGASPARLGVGTDGHVLTADAAATNGIKWAAAEGGSGGKYQGAWRQVGTGTGGLEHWYMVGSQQGTTPGSSAVTASGKIIAVPFFSFTARTIDRIAFRVISGETGGTNGLVGIYNNTSDTDLYPSSLLLTGTAASTATTGVKSSTVSQALSANTLYWAVYTSNSDTPNLTVCQAISAHILGWDSTLASAGYGWTVADAYDGTLPANYPSSATVITTSVPAIWVRYSA